MDTENLLKNQMGKYFFIKPKSVGPSKMYLGNNVSKVKLKNSVEAWSFISSQYVQSVV